MNLPLSKVNRIVVILALALPVVLPGCGRASTAETQLTESRNELAASQRELIRARSELKAVQKRIDDPKLANLRPSMQKLEARLTAEIQDLEQRVGEQSRKLAETEAQRP